MEAVEAARAELARVTAELERRQAAVRANRWCPQEPTERQAEFLALDCREALFGGAAGGGKSSCLLMDALADVETPGYAALLLRQTYQDLSLPGALMDRAGEWLRPTAARWSDRDKRWTFPSGAQVAFGYLETDKDRYRYQGAEFQSVAFDELTQFSEVRYRYLLSRIRRLEGSTVRLRARSASNPGGVGHDWVHERFVGEEAVGTFVPSLLSDNPHIDQASYRQQLELLDETTRRQLLEGAWIRDTQGLIYPLKGANLIDFPPAGGEGGWYYVLGVDLGASESKPTTAFVVLAWHRQLPGVFVLWSHAQAAMTPTTIAETMRKLAEEYGGFSQYVMDEGALGKGYAQEFRSRYAIPVQPAEKQSKLGFRKLLRGDLEHVRVQIVAPANEALVAECGSLVWDEHGLDNEKGASNHLTDALLYGWRACKAHAAKLPEYRPPAGSREAVEQEIREWEERDLEEARRESRKGRQAWWQRR